MTNRYLLGAGVALAVALGGAQAQAQFLMFPPGPGAFYFGGEGGWTHLDNEPERLPAPVGKLTAKFKDGFNVGARLGYQWGPWRLEEEYSYRQNEFSSLGPLSSHFVGGDRTTHSAMTNLLYDFTFGWPVTPHLGVGVGAVDIIDSPKLKAPIIIGRTVFGPANLFHGNQWVLGYQGIAGLEYNFNPIIALDVDYRYLGTTDPTFRNKSGIFPVGMKWSSSYGTHNVVASLIVRFGPPPPPAVAPPAPPAAAPPPPRNVYLVFFDWDKYNITSEGMAIIQQAAAQYRAGGRVQLQVTGYTDLSGSAGYNQRLSERRANAVANALVRFGVPRSDMAVSGRGMNNPRVPTAPGVREPQNRRVEIVFP